MDKLRITRDRLAAFIEDHDTIKQFENLFLATNEVTLTPGSGNVMNVITVAKENAQFNNIKDALESITDSSSTNRYSIRIGPGTYPVDNNAGPVQIPRFVGMSSYTQRSVVFVPQEDSNNMFIGGNFSYVIGIVFSGAGTGWCVSHELQGTMTIIDCVLRDCQRGFIGTNPLGALEVDNLEINNPLGVNTEIALKITAGQFLFSNILARIGALATTLIDLSGSNTIGLLLNIASVSPNVNNPLKIYDGAEASASVLNFVAPYDGLIIYGDNTDLRVDSCKIVEAQNDGFRIDNSGVNIRLSLFSTSITDAANLNFNILNPNSTTIGNGFTKVTNAYIEPGADIYAYLLDDTEGDEGLVILGQASVGSTLRPGELVVGAGDSHVFEKVASYDGISNWIDLTEEARSKTGSTFSFQAPLINNVIYIGNEYLDSKFPGIKTDIASAIDLGAGSIEIQYWNGSIWTKVNAMETQSFGEYESLADNIFSAAGNYHTYFNPIDSGDVGPWEKNNPLAGSPLDDGTDRYWVRILITATITTAPIFNQFKIHTNRFEINESDSLQKFGNYRDSIKPRLGSKVEGLSGFVPNTYTINYAVGISSVSNLSELGNNSRKGIVVSGAIEDGVDTSAPLELIVTFFGTSALAGNVELEISGVTLSAEEKRNGTAIPLTNQEIIPIGVGEDFNGKIARLSFDVSDSFAGDTFVVSVFRDSRPSNPEDTYGGSVVLEDVYVESYQWKL